MYNYKGIEAIKGMEAISLRLRKKTSLLCFWLIESKGYRLKLFARRLNKHQKIAFS